MKVYFVRHGETEVNIEKRYHTAESNPLSENGLKQANAVAKRFKHISIDSILTSDIKRAVQTAQIIRKVVKKPIEKTELLRERKRPSEFDGKGLHDPEVTKIKKETFHKMRDPNWRYSDEETPYEVIARAQKFIEVIEQRKEKNIIAVAHQGFIKFIISCFLFESDVKPDLIEYIYHFLESSNTGITICEKTFNKDQNRSRWHLVSWNDHAHLG